MKKITIDKVIRSLEELKERIVVDEETRVRAKESLDRMVEILPTY